MKAPSTALLKAFSPLWQPPTPTWTAKGCLAQQCAGFSSSAHRMARDSSKKNLRPKTDMRISTSSEQHKSRLQWED
ncbi:hypothetical protein BAUCODRAFT_37467 [Baudoinia panamericana UAMH 10762]|uniref:Uncharacterized protein n=1 Tax=Baudoinia panamericana (strain UAMH 10762) TaxID=717646 RepID=M2MMG7_BAUPA|nr:uncharacterized protein BAUCODRAFT_37467 [Baudoinia panamericana UAMH 10762]EMC92578.1 hypothetical protein BAUCODRAFT_37467 [Baudoinia panamericana UAMH 10762]